MKTYQPTAVTGGGDLNWTPYIPVTTWAYGDSLVKGGRGVDLPEILHILLAQIFPTVLPELRRTVAPPPSPPDSYAYVPVQGF